MTLQNVLMSAYDSGLQKNKKPFLLIDDGFQQLENAFCWRERVKKRDGIKLLGRLRRVITTTAAGNVTIGAATTTTFNLRTALGITGEDDSSIEKGKTTTITLSFAAPLSQIWTDSTGTGIMTGFSGSITSVSINYSTWVVTVIDNAGGYGASALTVSLGYYPMLPCMGIASRELSAINNESTVIFDTKYAYTFDGDHFIEMSSTVATTWTGLNSDFFWSANFRGSTADIRYFFATNFSGSDPIRYYNNIDWVDFEPKLTSTATNTSLYKARILIPYYGRLIALNTYEGNTGIAIVNSTNFFNRCRFSQIGDPTDQTNGWLTDVFGRGGFIDAPTNEAIVSARFYKSTLIVFFERSTWALQYVGEFGLPFVWERISSDFGSESTFSTVLFDSGVLAVGDKAIVASSTNNVERIDQEIPDEVYTFKNANKGKERVHGFRDFQKEIVYWTYVDGGTDKTFPNRVLIYNYRNNTWAVFRDNVTAFGILLSSTGDLWDNPIPWDDNVSWDTIYHQEFPFVISGNHQGYIHWYQYPSGPETQADSDVNAIEQESLYIKNITRSATASLNLQIIDHNLESLETIFITGMVFVKTDATPSTIVTTSLNNSFYQVATIVDKDNITITYYDYSQEKYILTSDADLGYTPASTATNEDYMGGGNVTLIPKLQIRTKDFNPFQQEGKQLMLSYVDFQTDATDNALVSIEVNINSSQNPEYIGNLLVGNTNSNTSLVDTGVITGATQANPCSIESINHGLKTGDIIRIDNILGMTQLNDNDPQYTVSFVDLNNFTLDDTDSSAYTAYLRSGNWTQKTEQFYYIPGQSYAWNRFYATVHCQYASFLLTYNDNLMNRLETHQQKLEMNAMNLWLRKAGRII